MYEEYTAWRGASFRAYLNESARIIEFTVDAVRNKQKVNLVNPQFLRVVG